MKWKVMMALVLVSLALITWNACAQEQNDIQKFPTCKYCNMDRQLYAYSRMLVVYDDGSSLGTCSIHCTAVDIPVHLEKTPEVLQVADYNTKNLIDAETAIWVIGGNKPGVMTKRAKWAFEKKEDAEAFVKINGGTIGTFDDAMRSTYEDMYADTKMIRDKRKMMKTKMMEKKQ